MQVLSTSDLLSVWERGIGQPLVQQGLLLLAASFPETPLEDLAQISIGRRNSRLLALREQLFGPELISASTCPACNKQLQLTFNAREVVAQAGEMTSDILTIALDGYEVHFRLPDSNDLLAISGSKDISAGRSLLLRRCLVEARYNGVEQQVEQLPQNVITAVTERMALADPQAAVQLNLDCPECGHNWSVAFDIVSYFWSEIHAWALKTLHDVHFLASAYGWRESDILAISPQRRQCYLDMIGGI